MVTLVISVLVGNLILQIVLGILNQKNMLKPWPKEVRGIYTIAQVKRAVEYSKENFQFSITSKFVSTILMILMITEGGFNLVNNWAITFSENESVQALFFMGTIIGANQIIAIPFSYYSTFVIEEKFGFNKTTIATYFSDKGKQYLLMIIIGGPVLGAILYFFENAGEWGWLYVWLFITFFSIIDLLLP